MARPGSHDCLWRSEPDDESYTTFIVDTTYDLYHMRQAFAQHYTQSQDSTADRIRTIEGYLGASHNGPAQLIADYAGPETNKIGVTVLHQYRGHCDPEWDLQLDHDDETGEEIEYEDFCDTLSKALCTRELTLEIDIDFIDWNQTALVTHTISTLPMLDVLIVQ